VNNGLGDPQPFFPECPALGKRAQLGMAPGEEGTGRHGRQENLAEALAALRPREGRHGLPKAVDCSAIVALGYIAQGEIKVRPRAQNDISDVRSEREGALARDYGLIIRATEVEMA
jgi:hypothetical protein